MKNKYEYISRIKFISFIAVIGFFVGCSQSATSVFKKDPIYAQNIQYTKIGANAPIGL